MKEKRITNPLRWFALFGVSAACALALAGCTGNSAESSSEDTAVATYADIDNMDLEYTDRDKDASYDEASATKIVLNGESAQVEGSGAQVDGANVTIDSAGTYVISGELANGQVRVNIPDTDKAQLVLAGASIHNETGAALFVEQADKCFVMLAEGTENKLSDGADYSFAEGEDEPDATLFSKDDLTINGSGSLAVTANYSDAIASKDDLTITGGTYDISATEDGLRGKDSLKICDGTFTVEAGEDCLKSSRDDDPTKGFVCIDGGMFELNAANDAVHGETYLRVTSGTITVPTCNEGLEAMVVQVDDGNIQIASEDDALNAAAPSASSDESASDETPEGALGQEQQGGQQNGQEGQHPQRPNAQDGGQTPPDLPSGDRPEPPEGSEAQQPNGSEPPSNANRSEQQPPAANGNEAQQPPTGSDEQQPSAQNDQQPQQPNASTAQGQSQPGGAEEGNESCKIIINGGTITLEAKGDAIDSNGSLTINGGTIFVTGPTSNGDGALDYALDAACNGGTLLIVGSAGMAQDFTSSAQPSAFIQVKGSADQEVIVADQAGTELFSYTPSASYETVIVSSPDFEEGKEYSLIIGSAATTFTATTK